MAEASNRNAIVTGAAGGMGRAITKALLESGRRVVLADRDGESLRQFAAEMGDNTFPIQLDITDATGVDQLPDLIPDAFRPIDILINNAGHDIGSRTRFDAGAADDWSAIIQTNLIGLMRVTRSRLPDMVKRNAGHIVNISSVNAVRIVPDMAAYSASKAGVHLFTETLRADLAETAIRITEMQPGLTRTNIILTRYRGDRKKEKDYFDQFKMALDPADIARSIVFALDQPPHVQIAGMLILPVNRY
jgi:3-hydroxy acid dehydrogenase / malonic semialdehyde reductase